MITCAGWESHNPICTRTVRFVTIVLIWFLTNHQIVGVFFLLLWANATRAQSLLIAINAQLAATGMIFLFWSTFTAFSATTGWTSRLPPPTASIHIFSTRSSSIF